MKEIITLYEQSPKGLDNNNVQFINIEDREHYDLLMAYMATMYPDFHKYSFTTSLNTLTQVVCVDTETKEMYFYSMSELILTVQDTVISVLQYINSHRRRSGRTKFLVNWYENRFHNTHKMRLFDHYNSENMHKLMTNMVVNRLSGYGMGGANFAVYGNLIVNTSYVNN